MPFILEQTCYAPSSNIQPNENRRFSPGMGSSLQRQIRIWNVEYPVFFKPSNHRELLVILLGLKSFRSDIHGKTIQILSNNITTIAYLNQLDLTCQRINRRCQGNLVTVSTKQCNDSCTASTMKTECDCGLLFKTKCKMDKHKWILHSQVFHMIDKMWGPHASWVILPHL